MGSGPALPFERIRSCATCGAVYRSDFQRCPIDGGELQVGGTDPLIGATVAEHYVVEALIGEGAMGRVYRAHHSRLLRKRYALKVMLGDLAASAAARIRFAHEAESASLLDHPNIVGVLDFGCTGTGLLYLVMELVEGPSLGHLLRNAPMPPDRVVRLARQLCGGLAHLHARGVVHRDLKPDNILVITSDEHETARIADLGLAISMADDDARLTATGVLCTPAYAAPEQLLGSAVDHRSDLYALGTTMFEMLTGGIMPFKGDARHVLSQKLSVPAPWILKVAPHVPVPLAQLIAQLLARDPDDRPATADVVAEVLDRLVGLRPIAVAPTVLAPRASASHPRWRMLPAVIALAAIGGFAWHQVRPLGDDSLAIEASAIELPTVDVPVTTERLVVSDRRVAEPAPDPTTRLSRPPTPPVAVDPFDQFGTPAEPEPKSEPSAPVIARVIEPSTPSEPPREPTTDVKPADPKPPDPPVQLAPPRPAKPTPLPPPVTSGARVAELRVDGALSISVVRRALDRVAANLSRCAAQVGARIVVVRFAIQGARRATGLQVSGPGAACIVAVLETVRTEVAPDVGDADVELQLAFGGK